jgi:hypothetical protein
MANGYVGQRYKSQSKGQHRNEDWSNALPPVSVVKPLTNQKEVERWLFQSLGMRLAQRRMMSNPDIRRALWTVFVGGLRYCPSYSCPLLFPSLLSAHLFPLFSLSPYPSLESPAEHGLIPDTAFAPPTITESLPPFSKQPSNHSMSLPKTMNTPSMKRLASVGK